MCICIHTQLTVLGEKSFEGETLQHKQYCLHMHIQDNKNLSINQVQNREGTGIHTYVVAIFPTIRCT